MATNGTLLTEEVACRLKSAGNQRVSISLDGRMPKATTPSGRGRRLFRVSLPRIEALKRAVLEFQINTTITQANLARIREIHDLA